MADKDKIENEAEEAENIEGNDNTKSADIDENIISEE